MWGWLNRAPQESKPTSAEGQNGLIFQDLIGWKNHPPYLPTILLYTNEQKVYRGLHRKVLAMLGYHVSPCLEKAKIKPHNNNENHTSKIQHICLTQEIVTGLQSC